MLSKYRRINGWSMALIDMICLAVWVFGVLIMIILNATESSPGEQEAAPIGCILILLLLVIFKVFPGGGTRQRYHLALSMGCTRRSILRAELFWGTLINIVAAMLLFGLYRIEMLLYRKIFPGASVAFDMDIVFRPEVLLGGILLFSVVPIFMAAMWGISKWIPYIIWMCICCLPSLLSSDSLKDSFLGNAVMGFERFWLNLSGYGICLIFCTIAAVLLLIGIGVLGKEDIAL